MGQGPGRVWTAVLGTVLAAGMAAGLACNQLGIGVDPAEQAKKRVQFVLEVLQEGGQETGTRMQTALCRWDSDVVLIPDRDMMGIASDAFDQWRREAGIYQGVKSFEIGDEVEEAADGDPDGTYYVSAKVNGSWHWLRVPPKARISWADE